MKFSNLALASLMVLASCSSAGPLTATSNKVASSKGEACKRNILFILPISSDNSIYSAAKDGKIAKISTIDQHTFTSIFYNTNCTVVHGSKDEPKVEKPAEVEVKVEKIEKIEGPKELNVIEDSEVETPEVLPEPI